MPDETHKAKPNEEARGVPFLAHPVGTPITQETAELQQSVAKELKVPDTVVDIDELIYKNRISPANKV